MTPEQLVEALLKLFTDGTALALTAAGVVVLTNIVKYFLKGVDANLIHIFIQVAVWLIYEIALARGFGAQFEQYWGIFITIVTAVASLFIADVAGKAWYALGRKADSPLFGYKRS